MADLEDDLQGKLRKQFCPPLDTTLFLVILSDYDLNDPKQLNEAVTTLDTLAASAAAEESSGFDPSGSGGTAYHALDQTVVELKSEEDAQSEETGGSSHDDVSLNTTMSSMDLEEDSAACKEHDAQLESLDPEGKMAVISSIFPGIKKLDIELTLKKCKNDAGKAIEELLNISLLEETGSRLRGVDGFSESDEAIRRRKKGKKKRKFIDNERSEDIDGPSPTVHISKWETASREIEFISTHTKHPTQQITSLYHKNGASTPGTILAIIESQKSLGLEYDDPNLDIYISELGFDFPSIPEDQIKALAELTYPNNTAGHELAHALTRPDFKKKMGGVTIEWRLLPSPDISPSLPTNLDLPSSLYPTSLPTTPTFLPPRTSTEARALRDKNFIQAGAAYRKGNSNNYQGAVAAYYAAQARDYDGVMRTRGSQEAEELVRGKKWEGGIDLHGVGVKDAVRIAREGVTEWWVGRRRREEEGRGINEGYRIVTGLGRHSVGEAKLGPAVGRMLIREGWKVEVGTGVLLVTGVTKK